MTFEKCRSSCTQYTVLPHISWKIAAFSKEYFYVNNPCSPKLGCIGLYICYIYGLPNHRKLWMLIFWGTGLGHPMWNQPNGSAAHLLNLADSKIICRSTVDQEEKSCKIRALLDNSWIYRLFRVMPKVSNLNKSQKAEWFLAIRFKIWFYCYGGYNV